MGLGDGGVADAAKDPSSRSGPDAWEDIAPVMFDAARWAEAPREVEQGIALLGLRPPAAILDLACGPGRHVLELARRGFLVTGVDATASFLQRAASLAADTDLSVELVHADMREFERPAAFDAVINMSTSFGYFRDPADDRRVLDNVRRSLRFEGALLMELVGKELAARTLKGREWAEEGDVLLLTEQRVRDDWTWIDNRLVFVRGGDSHELVLSHRLYSAAELAALLKAAGFGSVRMYGDLGGSGYDDAATRLVAVARPASD